MFYNCTFFSTIEHLANQNYGHELFSKPLSNPLPNEQREINKILPEFLQPASLSTKLTSSKSGIRVDAYQENLVDRQFCLSKFLQKSLIHKANVVFIATDEPNGVWLRKCLKLNKKKALFVNPQEFQPSFHYTRELEDWQSVYYKGVQDPCLMA